MINIMLSNCTTKNGNKGCVALALSTMYLLSTIAGNIGEECSFCLPQSGFELNEHGKHSFVSSAFALEYESIMSLSCNPFKNLFFALTRRNLFVESEKAYRETDCIFDLGQGDSFSDIYGKERFDLINRQHKLAAKYGIPYCFLPQTIGPFEDGNCLEEAIESLNNARLVFTRDKNSYEYVKKISPETSVIECTDVAFCLPYVKDEFCHDKVHVGLNVSALLWNGGYTMNNQFGLTVNYNDLIHSIINSFMKMDNVVIHLIPHVVGIDRDIENDYSVSYDLWKQYNSEKLVLAPMFLDPIIAKNYISGMDFFVGARMHSTIAAFSSGTAVCPMAYSRKFNGLFVETLDYKHIVDLKRVDNSEASRIIMESYQNREMLRTEVENRNKLIVAPKIELLKAEIIKFLQGLGC